MASIDPRTGKISTTPDMPKPTVYKKPRPAGETTPRNRRATPTRGAAAAASRRRATTAQGRTATTKTATPKKNMGALRSLRSGATGAGPRPAPRTVRSVATRRRTR